MLSSIFVNNFSIMARENGIAVPAPLGGNYVMSGNGFAEFSS